MMYDTRPQPIWLVHHVHLLLEFRSSTVTAPDLTGSA